MDGIKFQKRRYDVFISYGHADFARVDVVVRLLRMAGLEVWFDVDGGNAATSSSQLLSEKIGDSRAAVFFVSETWTRSSWCKGELERALSEARSEEEFAVISTRLDDVEAPGWPQNAEIIELRQGSPAAIARLLSSLGGRPPRRFDNKDDIYLSAPWSRRTRLTDLAVESLKQPGLAWRLVGDSPTHQHEDRERITAIMRTTRGVVAVLPYDSTKPPENTSSFILKEARFARDAGKPLLLLSEPEVLIPGDILPSAFLSLTLNAGPDTKAKLSDTLERFEERIQLDPHDDTGAFIFYAGSLKDRAEGLESVIERSSNMKCIRGERLSVGNVQAQIIDLVRRAALVIADVSDGRRNTLIEAGVAMGQGTPLRLMARNAAPKTPPKKAFMFEGLELVGYDNIEEQLCLCFGFAGQFRRRIYFG